jgi:uncharacterized protein
MLCPLLIMILIFASMSRRRRHYGIWGGSFWQWMLIGSLLRGMGGRRSNWGGGFGGFGGGGFGGSFGGGGRFGGGGGGASW